MKKMKLILGVMAMSAVTLISNQTYAQKGAGNDNAFEKGTVTLNVGIGVGRSSFAEYGTYRNSGYYGYGTGFGIKAAAERGMWQLGPGVLSLGAEVGGSIATARLDGYKSNIIIVAARSAYHFGWNVDKLDTYAGLSLGPGFRTNHYTNSYSRNDVIIVPGIFIGGSYFFSPNIGVNVEAGYDITEIQGGIIFKLK